MVADRVKAKGGEGSEDLFELNYVWTTAGDMVCM